MKLRYFRYPGDIIVTVARLTDDYAVTERWDWDSKKWVDAPHVVDALNGFSSSSAQYKEITEKEALALIAAGPTSKPVKKQ